MPISNTLFTNELNRISDLDLRQLVVYLLDNRVPSDIWNLPASSSLKYHPLNKEGKPETIAEHTKSVYRILHTIIEHPMVQEGLDRPVQNLLRASALLHDSVKYGYPTLEEHTVFEHPILIKSLIDDTILKNSIWCDKFDKICELIGSHHGPWRTSRRHDFSLPAIQSDAQWYLHLSDYLASRTYIHVDYDELI